MDEHNSPAPLEPVVGPDPPRDDPAPKAAAMEPAAASPEPAATEATAADGEGSETTSSHQTTEPAREPVREPVPEPDPMFFAGLSSTLKLLVQQERRHRRASLSIV